MLRMERGILKKCIYVEDGKTLNKIVPPGCAMGKRFYCEDGFKYLDKGKKFTVNLRLIVDRFLYLSYARWQPEKRQ